MKANIAAFSGVAVTTGIVATTGTYLGTRESVGYKFKDQLNLLSERGKFDTEGLELAKHVENKEFNESGKEELKALKEKIKAEKEDSKKGKVLKTGCSDRYSVTYTSAFNEEKVGSEKGLDEVCVYTIKVKLNGDELKTSNEFDNDWKIKVAEAEKYDTLKEIFKSKNGDEAKRKALQSGCDSEYKKAFITSKDEKKDDLLNETKKGCVLTIGEKIRKENKLLDVEQKDVSKNTDKNYGEKVAKNLFEYKKEIEPKLNLALEKVKESIKDKDGKDGQPLQSGCKDTYEKAYKGKEDQLGKLAEKFCKKVN